MDKKVLNFQKSTFELIAANSPYFDVNNFDVSINSFKISDLTKRDVLQLNISQTDDNRIKVLPRRFQQCLGPVEKLTAEGCSEAGLFRHLRNNALRSK